MPTQIQSTPVLYGADAKAVLDQLQKKPTPEQLKQAEERRKFWYQVKKRGL